MAWQRRARCGAVGTGRFNNADTTDVSAGEIACCSRLRRQKVDRAPFTNRQTQDSTLKAALESKADRDEIQCRRLARAGSSRWGATRPTISRLLSRYLQVWLERRHSIGRHRPRKAVGVDDALSQGRENAYLTQKRFLFSPSSLGSPRQTESRTQYLYSESL